MRLLRLELEQFHDGRVFRTVRQIPWPPETNAKYVIIADMLTQCEIELGEEILAHGKKLLDDHA